MIETGNKRDGGCCGQEQFGVPHRTSRLDSPVARLGDAIASPIALAALLVPCAMAQTPEEDRQREYSRQQEQQREEQQRRAQRNFNGSKGQSEEARKREQQLYDRNDEEHRAMRERTRPSAGGGNERRGD